MTSKLDPPHLRWLKQQAKFLKREQGISHTEALEIVAEREGWLDYEEAREVLTRLGKEEAGDTL